MSSSLREDLLTLCTTQNRCPRIALSEDATFENSRFTWLESQQNDLRLWKEGGASQTIPVAYLQKVMDRYGKPLAQLGDILGHIHIPGPINYVLAHMHFVPTFDVEPKDYLVWSAPGAPPLFELNALIVPPLLHLARALASSEATRTSEILTN